MSTTTKPRATTDVTFTTRSKSDLNVTIADVLQAADRIGADVGTIVDTLREYLRLPALPISHALGIDAALFVRTGVKRVRSDAAAALWAEVRSATTSVTVPEPVDGWQAAAACQGADTNLWFCDDEVCEAQVEAVETCVSCPAIGHCAVSGLFEDDGLWGGLTPRGRRDLRRYLRIGVVAPHPSSVAPLVAAMAASSLKARLAARRERRPEPPSLYTPDGRLFPVSATASAPCKRRKRNRPRPVATLPLFVC